MIMKNRNEAEVLLGSLNAKYYLMSSPSDAYVWRFRIIHI